MNKPLFWKLFLIFATGIVALFYLISFIATKTEEDMSMLAASDHLTLQTWGQQAEQLYNQNQPDTLYAWLHELQQNEQTLAAVVEYKMNVVVGEQLQAQRYVGFNMGRSVDWKVHLYFVQNPVMEIPFEQAGVSFLVLLPERMRPGNHWQTARLALHIFIPMILLALLAVGLYRHIMQPLSTLQQATRQFAKGDLSARAGEQLGKRNDELAELASTFDQMATRIGEQIVSQRHLIADLSHELRTPLTRLDIAVEAATAQSNNQANRQQHLQRVSRESGHIRRLVEDTLTLAWLENERPALSQEKLDLVDLIDVIIDDARFEFPQHTIQATLPDHAWISHTNHRAIGQALENIVRNAMRYTPQDEQVEITLSQHQQNHQQHYHILVKDNGPGVPEAWLETIFQPFFRGDPSRSSKHDSFGLGLALARRQLNAVGGSVHATNRKQGGLCMTLILPRGHERP